MTTIELVKLPGEIDSLRKDLARDPYVHYAQVKQDLIEARTWQMLEGEKRGEFASGEEANIKHDFHELTRLRNLPRYRRVLRSMAALASYYSPQAVWGVADGAQNDIAEPVAQILNVPIIRIAKDPVSPKGQKNFHYLTDDDQELAESVEIAVGFEDATTRLTSAVGALKLKGLKNCTRALIAALRRGKPSEELALPAGIEFRPIAEEYVPNVIDKTHPFYLRNREFIVMKASFDA